MAEKSDKIKTSQQKLFARYVELTGITSPALIAGDLDIPIETARTWIKRLLKTGFNGTSSISPPGSYELVQSHQNGSYEPPAPRVRAHKEYPSDINSFEEDRRRISLLPQIEGLNGSTTRLVELTAKCLGNQFAPAQPEIAHRILTGVVDAYGVEKTKIGLLELETAIESGAPIRNKAKALSTFAKNATTEAKKSAREVRQEKSDAFGALLAARVEREKAKAVH